MLIEQSVVCPVLVGHDAPLSAVFHILERARAAHGGTLLVSGEAGIGKRASFAPWSSVRGHRGSSRFRARASRLTVISGTFQLAMGKTFEANGMVLLHGGGFVTAPGNMAHCASAKGTTVVHVHAMGPFAMTYVNPADTPPAAAGK